MREFVRFVGLDLNKIPRQTKRGGGLPPSGQNVLTPTRADMCASSLAGGKRAN